MSIKIIIIGGRGTALNIAEQIIDAKENFSEKYELLGFANDVLTDNDLNNIPVVCKIEEINNYYKFNDVKFIFALYKPEKMKERSQLLMRLAIPCEKQISFRHPNSYISPSCTMGFGNVILSGTHIHNTVRIGNNNIINSSVVIEHDVKILNFNFISAHAVIGSNTSIKSGCFIGLNSSVRENVSIADFTFIGMGSTILKNIENSSSIWYGNPGRER
jgi:sugar O-acyltransferase (sialic acid O-acetyltransferase NeuD family)